MFYTLTVKLDSMFQDGNRFKILFAIGAVILVIGLVVRWYPSSIIEGLQTRLGQTGLAQDERDKLQGTLNSWQIWQITTFQPLSSLLFAVGIIILVYSVIYGIFTITSTYKIVKKQEKD
jgi:ABC-type phosphate transport system permease subunit